MSMMHDPMDQLLREAAGSPTDPSLPRRATRAALGLKLAQRERREARTRVARTLAIAAMFVAVLCGQLGSDNFDLAVETRQVAGRTYDVARQGLRGEEFWSLQPGQEGAIDEAMRYEWLQQRAAGQGILVAVTGWQLGAERHFILAREMIIDGEVGTESMSIPGQSDRIPPGLKAYMAPNHRLALQTFEQASKSRAPDLTVPMYFNDLLWIVEGWRVRLPGKEEIIYYKGLRADGVRSRDASAP